MPDCLTSVLSQKTRQINLPKTQNIEEIKHVKIIVFDSMNSVLVIKNKNNFVLPCGCVEWDDDDAEAAARREVFEATNISLGLVKPITVVKTKDSQKQIAQTIIFVGRMMDEEQAWPEQQLSHCFMSKETFFETPCDQSNFICSLLEVAYRVLVSEEINDEHEVTTREGREKYNLRSLL